MGVKDREEITRVNGEESVEIAIYKEGGTNTVTVVDRVTGQLDSVRERLQTTGRQLDLTVITDQARYIRQSVADVTAGCNRSRSSRWSSTAPTFWQPRPPARWRPGATRRH